MLEPYGNRFFECNDSLQSWLTDDIFYKTNSF